MVPTPKPAKNLDGVQVSLGNSGGWMLTEEISLAYLPALNKGSSIAQVWSRTPMAKTPTEMRSGPRRPSLSPKGAAMRAPKKVPALSMDTTWADWAGEILRWLFASM